MELTNTINQPLSAAGYLGKLANWLKPAKNKTITDWTVEQLNIQPYQHILEIGYGSGYTLKEVARKLKIGFLAGIDSSVAKYRRAYRKNKKMIRQQLLQLHIGNMNELPYPNHYFHTVYGNNVYFNRKEPVYALLHLAGLLRSGGKLVMVFQPAARNEKEIKQAAERIKQQYLEAGLINIRIEFRDMHPATAIAVTGYRE
jgi:ubiquinone/menaquinone biosynthesis C-methylase UbiE